jgi:hypothetical protein
MKLKGSCHCAAVSFRVESNYPQPYMRCYCSICRKAGGGGGYGINIAGVSKSLEIEGKEHVRVYRAKKTVDGREVASTHERHFCSLCGCHLWAFNSKWPDLLHPVAGCIDTELPTPVGHVHIMLASKASWVEVEGAKADPHFDEYPDTSIAKWHEDQGVVAD